MDQLIQVNDTNKTRDQKKNHLFIITLKIGKTTFAQSLPGLYNYYDDEWNPDTFNPYADYTIYDNIHWDEFENMNYPDKKLLLLQGGRIHVCKHDTSVC